MYQIKKYLIVLSHFERINQLKKTLFYYFEYFGCSMFGVPNSDWTPDTSQDSSSSIFSVRTDSDCNSVTSEYLS
jgi:hypothetical protein